MKSKTKYLIDSKTVKKLCKSAGYKDISEIKLLGNGEFNAVYGAKADEKSIAIKIAPPQSADVMTYEKNMMKAELYWYDMIKEHTSVRVPEIYYKDFSRKLIDADWFIMEKLHGVQMDEFDFTPEEKEQSQNILAQMAGEMHNIIGNKFGYVQNEMYENWYRALLSFAQNLLNDCQRKGKTSRRGKKFIKYINSGKEIFEKAPSTMVNYDIWAANVICRRVNGKVEYSWIDPERSFYGDPIFDFCCLDFLTPLENKKSIVAHNKVSSIKILTGREERIRYAASLAMMAFITETERYYRYTPFHYGFWRNTYLSFLLYRTAFKEFKSI